MKDEFTDTTNLDMSGLAASLKKEKKSKLGMLKYFTVGLIKTLLSMALTLVIMIFWLFTNNKGYTFNEYDSHWRWKD